MQTDRIVQGDMTCRGCKFWKSWYMRANQWFPQAGPISYCTLNAKVIDSCRNDCPDYEARRRVARVPGWQMEMEL